MFKNISTKELQCYNLLDYNASSDCADSKLLKFFDQCRVPKKCFKFSIEEYRLNVQQFCPEIRSIFFLFY